MTASSLVWLLAQLGPQTPAPAEPVPTEPTLTSSESSAASTPSASAPTEGEPPPAEPTPTEPDPAPLADEAASPVREDAAPAPVPAPAPEVGPAPASEPATPERAAAELTWARRGLLVGLGLGFVGCETGECDDLEEPSRYRFVGGLTGQLDVGWRVEWLAPVASLAIGSGRMDWDGEYAAIDGRMSFFDIDAGLLAFPVRRGRFDPYLGVRVGYAGARGVAEVPGGAFRLRWERLGVGFTAGLGIRLGRHWSLGPRWDMTLPLAGNVCGSLMSIDGEATECDGVAELPDELRRELPRWWSVSLHLHLVLPDPLSRA